MTFNHSFIGTTIEVIKWSKSIAGKFFGCVPAHTSAVVVFTIISQLSLTLAFFLPLKVIILLGSEGIPSYFPGFLSELGKDKLVINLAILAGVFYLLHLCSRLSVAHIAQQGARSLVRRNAKHDLFTNSDRLAETSYLQYSRSFSGLVFVLLSLLITWFIYPDLLVVVLLFVSGLFFLIALAFTANLRITGLIQNHLNSTLTIFSAVGFLIVFGYMVFDFLGPSKPNVIQSIVGLLLTRQVLGRLSSGISDLTSLFSKRNQVNALFFHNKKLAGSSGSDATWKILDTNFREDLVKKHCSNLGHGPDQNITLTWCDRPTPGVYTFIASIGGTDKQYLFKLYQKSESYQAAAEVNLSKYHGASDLPIAEILHHDEVDDFSLNIFKWPNTQEVLLPEFKTMRLEALSRLATVVPEKSLAKHFDRSKLSLADRLDETLLQRLGAVVGTTKAKAAVARLNVYLPAIRHLVAGIQKQYVNKDLNNYTLMRVAESGLPVVTHWGRWTVEPLGSGWPVPSAEFDVVWERVVGLRSEISESAKSSIRVVALLYAIEQRFSQSLYVSAFSLIDEILLLLDETIEQDALESNANAHLKLST